MRARLHYWIALWLAAYLWGCVHFPEPDDTLPILCDDGTAPTEWCGCDSPSYGSDC